MATTGPLHLFPAPMTNMPRKSSLKKSNHYARSSPISSAPVRGLALRIATPDTSQITTSPEVIKHSLFCEPASKTSSPQQIKASPESSRLSSSGTSLASLPESSSYRSRSSGTCHSATKLLPAQRIDIVTSNKLQSDPSPIHVEGQLSPPLSKRSFTQSSSPMVEYPTPVSMKSASPVFPGNATNKSVAFTPDNQTAPIRSMFPQYDPTKPLNAQQYFPTSPPRSQAVNRSYSADDAADAYAHKPLAPPQRFNTGGTMIDGYEHIPFAEANDMLVIWKASRCGTAMGARKLRLGIHQPSGRGTSIAIGRSAEDILYSMHKSEAWQSFPIAASRDFLFVQKHCPLEPAPVNVAQIEMPSNDACKPDATKPLTSIFPQMAAIDAVETVANSAAAYEISSFDPTGSSRAATRLAQGAITERRRLYNCDLKLITRRTQPLGAVLATYALTHPVEGDFPIAITRSVAKGAREPRARICIHHPSATPAAVAAETLTLAFLDFGRDACVVDVPGLLAFESPYLLDLVFSSLLAVAAIESTALKTEVMTFDAPPTSVTARRREKRNTHRPTSAAKRKFFGRSKSVRQTEAEKVEMYGEQVDLPALQGAAALLGLSVKVAIALLETGVKMTANAVTNANHTAKDLS